MSKKKVQTALISVFSKEGLAPIVDKLHEQGVVLFSTGGTQTFIEERGIPVHSVESLTSYPSILDGRVKTLHPKIFGGILARREKDHLDQLDTYSIPPIDLVLVDLYPFEETVAKTTDESAIIEKIDIGGISLIRAAAKNYQDVWIVSSRRQYASVLQVLESGEGVTELEQRKQYALEAFGESSRYDTAIFQYFSGGKEEAFRYSVDGFLPLRYGENPHQQAGFYGHLNQLFEKKGGKELSYNNLVDIDAAIQLMAEFKNEGPTFAILKHTNPCGVASRSTVLAAWEAALAGDPVSAFGGILITNSLVDGETASAIDKIFYEVLIAPEFTDEALDLLRKKKNRVQLEIKTFETASRTFKRMLNGVVVQDADQKMEGSGDLTVVTKKAVLPGQVGDLVFANKCVKHLKSNAIALAKDRQLIGIGCGQTSRVDAVRQAIEKARAFGFKTDGAVLASDAFFPFADSVQLALEAGIAAVIQPGGSVRDQESIDFCDEHGMAMVTTGIRHFRH